MKVHVDVINAVLLDEEDQSNSEWVPFSIGIPYNPDLPIDVVNLISFLIDRTHLVVKLLVLIRVGEIDEIKAMIIQLEKYRLEGGWDLCIEGESILLS